MTDIVGASEKPRPIAGQPEAELGGAASILVRQRRDHAELDSLMRRYELTQDPRRRAAILGQVSRRALRHAFAEETVLFPACRKHLGAQAEASTARIEGEHQVVNDLLQELQGADPRGPGHDERVARVFALIRDDARAEEDDLLARLRTAVDVSELRRIGAAWEKARIVAPTRPHPRVSRRPPGNVLAAPALAVWDRARDAASTAHTAEGHTGRASPSWRTTLGVGLCAGAAGVAVMTLGEKIEQSVTGRVNSHVPRKTLQRLAGGHLVEVFPRSRRQRFLLNHAMHWGQGVALGPVRALLARKGQRGVMPSLAFAVLRFGLDQTLENATGVGSPPHTWPRDELVMDVTHKLVYGLATGLVADRLLPRT